MLARERVISYTSLFLTPQRRTWTNRLSHPSRGIKGRLMSSYIPTQAKTVYTSSLLSPELDLEAFRGHSRTLFGNTARYFHPSEFNFTLPIAGVPEYAFVGKSNVGKSSLIGALIGNQKNVRVSKSPGCTRSMNYFGFPKKRGKNGAFDVSAYVVDLPGYGFAKATKNERRRWNDLIKAYLQCRDPSILRRVYLLIDSRYGIRESDIAMMLTLNAAALPYEVVITKVDLISGNNIFMLSSTLESVFVEIMKKGRMSSCVPYVHTVSSKSGVGLDFLLMSMAKTLVTGPKR